LSEAFFLVKKYDDEEVQRGVRYVDTVSMFDYRKLTLRTAEVTTIAETYQ
jgi:hypothetical protein